MYKWDIDNETYEFRKILYGSGAFHSNKSGKCNIKKNKKER